MYTDTQNNYQKIIIGLHNHQFIKFSYELKGRDFLQMASLVYDF